MSEQRPQYGEYATVEEQRRLAGLPPLDAVEAVPAEPAALRPAATASPEEAAPKPRSWDRLLTIALLAYGVVNVFMTAGSYLDLPAVMNESLQLLGVDGEFSNFAQGRLWGTIAAAVLVIGWVITAVLSMRRLRTGKISWWVPLVGALATGVVVSFCIAVPMMGDPAFLSYLESMTGV
ncbi:DUF6264 family protein [uncultured Microbacterium sp.]|uniref:DUF6264 family protein n=1 Tax=uncultured Microbacterium sp. TaxID=191216 RepID=UPI00262BE07C|nr:DUF6264 family protein [uncultured Microbacterium sp.]